MFITLLIILLIAEANQIVIPSPIIPIVAVFAGLEVLVGIHVFWQYMWKDVHGK